MKSHQSIAKLSELRRPEEFARNPCPKFIDDSLSKQDLKELISVSCLYFNFNESENICHLPTPLTPVDISQMFITAVLHTKAFRFRRGLPLSVARLWARRALRAARKWLPRERRWRVSDSDLARISVKVGVDLEQIRDFQYTSVLFVVTVVFQIPNHKARQKQCQTMDPLKFN